MKVCILYDQIDSDSRADQTDALVQADAIEETLCAVGHSVERSEFHLGLATVSDYLTATCPDLVFNLVESVEGKGSLIHLAPALLDSLQLPYTGAPQAGIYSTSNKTLAKWIMRMGKIPTPDWIASDGKAGPEPVHSSNHRQWIVKSVWEHASVGLTDSSVVNAGSFEQVREVLTDSIQRFGGEWFAETLIDGREFNVSLLDSPSGPEVIAVSEIKFLDFPAGKPRILGYASKWETDSFEYRNTVRTFDLPASDECLVRSLCTIALDCWDLFSLKGYARVDFRVDNSGNPWVLEVNANPCLSPDAGFYAALEESRIGFPEGIRRILAAAHTTL